MWLPQDFRVIGLHEPAVYLAGHLKGVVNLTLADSRHLQIHNTFSNWKLTSGEYVDSDDDELRLAYLSFEANSRITYPTGFKLLVTEVMMRYSSSITGESIQVNVTDLNMEGEAKLDVSGRGHHAEEGPG